NLKSKKPGPWEVYDLSTDRGETKDVAAANAELIAQAEALLRQEVSANAQFPLEIPGVNADKR
ncbi:MAG: hypothetical protein NTV80_19125, partial [Verrucomicrobia bacterium]|nr:hypothetical protein [Verrucomicrobiota bacterium]